MNFKKILVAIDFSTHSVVALRRAASLAKACESELYVVHAVESLSYRGVPYVEPMSAKSQERAQKAALQGLEEAVSGLGEDAPTVVTEVIHGDPRSSITSHAEQHGIDLIVVGAAGYGRVRKLLLGSISSHVAQTASCSVMIIRD